MDGILSTSLVRSQIPTPGIDLRFVVGPHIVPDSYVRDADTAVNDNDDNDESNSQTVLAADAIIS